MEHNGDTGVHRLYKLKYFLFFSIQFIQTYFSSEKNRNFLFLSFRVFKNANDNRTFKVWQAMKLKTIIVYYGIVKRKKKAAPRHLPTNSSQNFLPNAEYSNGTLESNIPRIRVNIWYPKEYSLLLEQLFVYKYTLSCLTNHTIFLSPVLIWSENILFINQNIVRSGVFANHHRETEGNNIF